MNPYEDLILTRYLYSKVEVKHSLFIALLNRAYDEVLFWAYELYFSGFEEEVTEYILSIYEELYEKENPKLRRFIEATIQAKSAVGIGSILATLVSRPYSLAEFITTYFHIKCTDTITGKPCAVQFIVRLTENDIQPYLTREPGLSAPRLYLREVCRYTVHKNVHTLFQCKQSDFTDQYRMNWLYYAAGSPIWAGRIAEYDGVIDHDKKKVLFPEDDEDVEVDDSDSFYQTWELEPDEQPLSVQQKSIGNGQQDQYQLVDFCHKYGVQPAVKLMKKKVETLEKIESIKTPEKIEKIKPLKKKLVLTNDIVLSDKSHT